MSFREPVKEVVIEISEITGTSASFRVFPEYMLKDLTLNRGILKRVCGGTIREVGQRVNQITSDIYPQSEIVEIIYSLDIPDSRRDKFEKSVHGEPIIYLTS